MYTVSGIYSNIFTALNNCDSIVNLTLLVNTPVTTNLVETICDGGQFIPLVIPFLQKVAFIVMYSRELIPAIASSI